MEMIIKNRIRDLKAKLNLHYAVRTSSQVNTKLVDYIEREIIKLMENLKYLSQKKAA